MDNLNDVFDPPFLVEVDSERVVLVGEGLPFVEVGSFDFLLEGEFLLKAADRLGAELRLSTGDALTLNLVRESEGRSSSKGERSDESKFSGTKGNRGERRRSVDGSRGWRREGNDATTHQSS